MGIDTTVIPLNASAVKADILATVGSDINLLGEIRQFALTIAGALTKSQLQAKGWAICDGTTPASQGISSPTITTTPDLREKFLRHSANEVTGGTGSETYLPNHRHSLGTNNEGNSYLEQANSGGGTLYTSYASTGTALTYYDICYFIKVKV